MLDRRARVALVLAVLHLGLVATAVLHSPDFAWAPSYFDDDDGDFLPLVLSEQVPALVDLPRAWTPVLMPVAAVAVWRPRARSRLASARPRFRAPPCP
jgi:hypothetical protein